MQEEEEYCENDSTILALNLPINLPGLKLKFLL